MKRRREKNPSEPTPFGNEKEGEKKLNCCRILRSDVFTLKFNCEKLLSEAAVTLVNGSWGLQRHTGPPRPLISPPCLPLLLHSRNSQSTSLALIIFSHHPLSPSKLISAPSLPLSSPMFLAVRCNKKNRGVGVIKLWKNY